jgi:hypothetical protein
LVGELPAKTEMLPEFVSIKSEGVVFENHALALELGFALFLNALALSNASTDMVIGPEYFFEDSLGETRPSYNKSSRHLYHFYSTALRPSLSTRLPLSNMVAGNLA